MALELNLTGENSLLLRISKKQYLEKMQEGHIFMNRASYYRKCEDAPKGIPDTDEGLLGKSFKLTVDEMELHLLEPAKLYAKGYYPILCASELKIKQLKFPYTIDPRLKKDFISGDEKDYGVLLIDKASFLQRLIAYAKEQRLFYSYGSITYRDIILEEKFAKPSIDVFFRKNASFSYQNEWRFLIWNSPANPNAISEDDTPYEFNIGSIKEISVLTDTKYLKSKLVRRV